MSRRRVCVSKCFTALSVAVLMLAVAVKLIVVEQGVARIRRPLQLALIDSPGGVPRFDHGGLLNPRWATNASFRATAASALRQGKYVHLENAFDDAFARRVATELEVHLGNFSLYGNVASDSDAHRTYLGLMDKATNRDLKCDIKSSAKADDFKFHHHNIYDRARMEPALATLLGEAAAALSGEGSPMRAILDDAFGYRPSALRDWNPSWYKVSDFSSPHRGLVGGRDVAVIWHLADGIEIEHGGGLIWCNPFARITPKFNALTLFAVTPCSYHYVEPVFSDEGGARRLAVNGWFVNLVDEFVSDRFGSRSSTLKSYRDAQPIPARATACKGSSVDWMPPNAGEMYRGAVDGRNAARISRFGGKAFRFPATASSSASPRGGLAFAKHAKPDSLTFDKPRRRVIGI